MTLSISAFVNIRETVMKVISSKEKKLYIIGGFVLCMFLAALNTILSIKYTNQPMQIGNVSFGISTINGCIQTFSFFICVLLIFISPKDGLKVSVVTIGFGIIGISRAAITQKMLAPLPGVFNCALFLILAIVTSRQFIVSEKRAVTDDLTGISNGSAFLKDMYDSVYHSEKGYLFLVHLDGFIPVNSTLGRESGDEVLKVIAARLDAAFKEQSKVYKIDGAEYAIISSEDVECNEIAERIVKLIEDPVTLTKNDIPTNCYLSAYVGVAPYLTNDLSVENIIKHADIAMNYAINSEREKVCVFSDNMREKIDREIEVERMVKESLKNDYFFLVYQPQYTAGEKRLRGFETLIRMNHPSKEFVSPGEFIAIAEKSNLIFDIDDYVLRRAVKEFKALEKESDNTLIIAVNVSAKDIAREGFAMKVLDILKEVDFPEECLEIEITEYSFADMQSSALENIFILRNHNILIALDDFGTGYTSLEQLMRLPVNLLKLDKSLIDNVATKKLNADFVKTVIYMGHLMNAEVIAEGVEDENQLDMLRTLECDFTQGYLWGKPMEYDNARQLVEKSFYKQKEQ